MTFRLLQNFKGGRALVITRRVGWESTLETTLAKLGMTCDFPEIVDGRAQIDVATLSPERDILFVDGDLDGVVAIEVEPVSKLPPVPVIGLVGVEAPSRLKAARSTPRCSWASTSSYCAATCMRGCRISRSVAVAAVPCCARSSF
jgi:hypothetical protein